MNDQIYDYGLGFGAIKLDSTKQENFSETNTFQNNSVLDKALTVITGTNPNGTPKKFDLNKYITLPDFAVKAKDSQWWVIALILLGTFLGIKYLTKDKKRR